MRRSTPATPYRTRASLLADFMMCLTRFSVSVMHRLRTPARLWRLVSDGRMCLMPWRLNRPIA
jgi:hypothetical protein